MGINKNTTARVTIVAMVIVVLTVIMTMSSEVKVSEANKNTVDMNVTAEYLEKEDAGYVSWEQPNRDEPYLYQVYSKKPDTDEFQSISTTDLNRKVRVLNVYPDIGAFIEYKTWDGTERRIRKAGSLEQWMEEPNELNKQGYGMGLIDVDPMTLDEFNEDPHKAMEEGNGEWAYDVIFFGSWDTNNMQDITVESRDLIVEFVESGRGILYGHDTIDGYGNKNFIFATLRDLGNIHLRSEDADKVGNFNAVGSNTVQIRKEGLLTKYPWAIGNIGTNLTIPMTHTGVQIAYGDIWMDFVGYETNPTVGRRGPVVSGEGGRGTNNFYLTSWNNSAMIQTGHSNGQATPDEQKVLANTLFYLAQLTDATDVIDRSSMDVYAPEFDSDKVDVKRSVDNVRLTFSGATDPLMEYQYYVKATGQDTSRELFSETVSTLNATGLRGYSYVMDNKPDTLPDEVIDIKAGEDTVITIPNDESQGRYVHITAIDKAGNVSEPKHIDLAESYFKVSGNVFADTNFNGLKDNGEKGLADIQVSLEDTQGRPVTDLNGNPYITKTDNNGNYNFGVYSGGNMMVKFGGMKDKLFTVRPDASSGGIQNHVLSRLTGLSGVFTLDDNNTNEEVNAGLVGKEAYFKDSNLGVVGKYDREVDGIYVDWEIPDLEEPYVYQVYSQKPDQTDFQTVSTVDLDRKVNVLNIYPEIPDVPNVSYKEDIIEYTTWDGTKRSIPRSGSLEMWMEQPNAENPKGYGMGVIDVTPVSLDDFEINPDKYLKDSKGAYKYDVVNLGNWDSNGRVQFTDSTKETMREYIDSGRGFLSGHDTNTDYIQDYLNFEGGEAEHRYGSEVVTLSKKGLLTNYPWYIGEVGSQLRIPVSHTQISQTPRGDVWLQFEGNGYHKQWVGVDKSKNNFYLTTNNNVAYIQTGHSSGLATPDEQKILANTLFYLSQRTEETGILDNSAMDIYEPVFEKGETEVDRTDDTIKVSYPKSVDPVKEFDYYVKAIGEGTGMEITSETISVSQTSGVSGYSHTMSNSPTTKPNNQVDTKETTLEIPNNRSQKRYLHISAVDLQGNVSDPINVDLSESYYRVEGNLFMDANADGIRNEGESFVADHTVSLVDIYGVELLDLNNEPYQAVTDANGYYRFDVFTGGQMRLKVEPLENRRFTGLPDEGSEIDGVYNQIVDRVSGLTDIFTVNDKNKEVTRNAGFTFKELDYEIEHINKETGNSIIEKTDRQLNGRDEVEDTILPISNDRLPNGYTYTNEYRVNDGNLQVGDRFKLDYDEYTRKVNIKLYYEFTGVDNTTKRFQGDNLDSPIAFDSYTNAGIYTRRSAMGDVTETGMNINATFLLDEFEAPIAIVPKNVNLKVLADDNVTLQEVNKNLGSQTVILNSGYLDSLEVASRFGGSNVGTTVPVNVTNLDASTHERIYMKDSIMKGTKDVRLAGASSTDATIGVNEDSNYIGRWINEPIELYHWSPNGIGGIRTNIVGEENINRAINAQTSYEIDIYNILEHRYMPRLDSNGNEYYEYTGSTLKQGYYPYTSSGNRIDTIRGEDSSFTQTTHVSLRDIEVGSYANTDGFSLEDGKVAPIQRQVATEVIDGGGQALSGYQTETITDNTIPAIEDTSINTNLANYGDREVINYYEEFVYIPYSLEEELITQQAIPVGGRMYYVDPYEYMALPTYLQPTVNAESGNTLPEIRNNVSTYNSTGKLSSDIEFTQEESGLYVSDVDEYERYEQTIAKATPENQTYMDNKLDNSNEIYPNKTDETGGYQMYKDNIGESIYKPIGGVQSSTSLDYRMPLTYVHGTNELLLEDTVAVGQDTGYPVYGHYATLEEDYKRNYQSDIGNLPSDSDKLITSNKGSIYLIPMNNQGQKLRDKYRVREFINQIGTSQLSLVNDKTYTTDKYIYGRGNNVIYSGSREELDNSREFISDHVIKSGVEYKETKPVNGIRTGNNSEINSELLPEEEE